MGLGSSFGIAAETGNNIVTDGLIFYIDAAYKKSYPGDGSTWTDIINNSVGTITNATFDSSGYFDFDGAGDRIDFAANSNLNFGTGNWTVSCWARQDVTGVDGFYRRVWMMDGPTGNNVNNPQLAIVPGDYGTEGVPNAWSGGGLDIADGSVTMLNTWRNNVVVRNGSTVTLYTDGSVNGTPDTSIGSMNLNNLNNPGGPRVRLGSYSDINGNLGGQISSIQMYNRALTTGDILQNYNAQKERFGF